jgi:hypothetical protein
LNGAEPRTAAPETKRSYGTNGLEAPICTASTSRPQAASASSAVGASTITRTSCSVPLGPHENPPAALQGAALALDRLGQGGAVHGRVAVGDGDVDEALGQLAHRGAVGQIGAAERLQREQGAGDAVAGGDEAHVDDVAGLLAAQCPAAVAQGLEDVAVADLRRGDLDRRPAHGRMEAVVRHDRDGYAVARQPPGARRCSAARAMSSSPSTTAPVRSTASTRSPSPSNAKPRACRRRPRPARACRGAWSRSPR